MSKIQLLMKKEEIDQEKLNEHKIVIVFDILLATSTITAVLENGAKEVIPVLDRQEAYKVAEDSKDYLLVGEFEGATLDGFLSPAPTSLKDIVAGKTIILSTTNGTVALKNSSGVKKVYACSLLNSKAVASHIQKEYDGESIVLVCAGSSNNFNLEDFYGAGYFINCLLNETYKFELSDSAKAAHLFYVGNKNDSLPILLQSSVGNMLVKYGFEDELKFVSQHSVYNVIPLFIQNNRIVNGINYENTISKID